jgi:DNA modification methylase
MEGGNMPDNLDDLRHIEGFPIGEDEDLLALSDPPHYTAYPNPHIAKFIQKWGKPYDEAADDYHREPYVADVSEGKTEPIYMAHTYHAKVPPAAVARFIDHYCEPGGVALDVFCGTGMTGVAASRVGCKAILLDLSPVATFISSVFNSPHMNYDNIRQAIAVVKKVNREVNWVYETKDPQHGTFQRIHYVLWSDVFSCPYCGQVAPYVQFAYILPSLEIVKPWRCPYCQAQVNKKDMEPVFDHSGKVLQSPFLTCFKDRGGKSKFKEPDDHDLSLLERIDNLTIPSWYPSVPMLLRKPPWGDMWRSGYHAGFETVADFFTKRSLYVLALLWERAEKLPYGVSAVLRFAITSVMTKTGSRMHNVGISKGSINLAGQIPNTLQPTSIHAERHLPDLIEKKLNSFKRWASRVPENKEVVISTQSATDLANVPDETIDYIFVDPPFGGNIIYSEMNFIWEAWLQAYTNSDPEAICSKTQHKDLASYRNLMLSAFQQLARKLKPGRWITVEFHNSSAAVWNAIQESLARAGFVVAQVAVLDKGQGTYKQQTAPGTVKNDLVINAYKPRKHFEEQFLRQAGYGLEQEFVRQHLGQLPVAANVERSREMLYSKYLAYYVQHGYQVAYNSQQFYHALSQWGLVERDGYWFADEAQAQEYENRKVGAGPRGKGIRMPGPQAALFIIDERSARQWLWDFLETPRTYDQIYTAFVKALQTPEDQLPEPMTMLEEGFVRTNGQWKRPDALTQAELEERRHARLLRQFGEYLEAAQAGGRLKEVRKEAVLAGFTEAYRSGRFQDILAVGRRLPKKLVESSADLFDFIDIAEAKIEA